MHGREFDLLVLREITWVMTNRLRLGVGLCLLLARLAPGHRVCSRSAARPRIGWSARRCAKSGRSRVIARSAKPCCEAREITRQVPVWETQMRERRYKVLRPVQETSMREERFCVQRPVYETVMRDCSYNVVRNVVETCEREERYIVSAAGDGNADARGAVLRAAAGTRDGDAAAVPDGDATGDDVPDAICRSRLLGRSGGVRAGRADVAAAHVGAADAGRAIR